MGAGMEDVGGEGGGNKGNIIWKFSQITRCEHCRVVSRRRRDSTSARKVRGERERERTDCRRYSSISSLCPTLRRRSSGAVVFLAPNRHVSALIFRYPSRNIRSRDQILTFLPSVDTPKPRERRANYAGTKNYDNLRAARVFPAEITLASHRGEPGSIPGRVTRFSQVGIVPDDAVGWRVFSGISSIPRPFIPALLASYSLRSPSSALKTSLRDFKHLCFVLPLSLDYSFLGHAQDGTNERLAQSRPAAEDNKEEWVVGNVDRSLRHVEVNAITPPPPTYSRHRKRQEEDECSRACPAIESPDLVACVPNVRAHIPSHVGSFFIRSLFESHHSGGSGGVVVRPLASHQGEPGSIPDEVPPPPPRTAARGESCRTRTLIDGSSRRSPVSPSISFRRCSLLAPLHSPRLSRLSMLRAAQITSLTLTFEKSPHAPGNSAPINEHSTTLCPNHVQFTQKGRDLISRQQPIEERSRLERLVWWQHWAQGRLVGRIPKRFRNALCRLAARVPKARRSAQARNEACRQYSWRRVQREKASPSQTATRGDVLRAAAAGLLVRAAEAHHRRDDDGWLEGVALLILAPPPLMRSNPPLKHTHTHTHTHSPYPLSPAIIQPTRPPSQPSENNWSSHCLHPPRRNGFALRHSTTFLNPLPLIDVTCPCEDDPKGLHITYRHFMPLVRTVFDTSWRTLTQSSISAVTADNQCIVDIGICVHKTVESSMQSPVHPSCPSVLSIRPVHPSCPYVLSIRPVHPSYPSVLSIRPVHTSCPSVLSIRSVHPSCPSVSQTSDLQPVRPSRDSTAVCTDLSMSTVRWLSAVTEEGADWATVFQEASNAVCVPTAKAGGKRVIPEKKTPHRQRHRPGTNPFSENPATRPGIEPGFTLEGGEQANRSATEAPNGRAEYVQTGRRHPYRCVELVPQPRGKSCLAPGVVVCVRRGEGVGCREPWKKTAGEEKLYNMRNLTGDRDEVHFEPPKLAVAKLDPRSAAVVDKYSLKILQQYFYIGTNAKLDPGSELGKFELGSWKMLVQPGITLSLLTPKTRFPKFC
ncbi:hypothetical protein PR048_033527 [Dryococelus australis]|uniref:Uncharacterized protein n=1 Tax=Dryococelus australis TaxID=614101 RepID=A0ABQ9G0I9_9NEOP|nr:hypothetical protein PR048_033527 [Dryococelus australis]